MKTHQAIILLLLAVFSLDASAQNYSSMEFIENKGQWDARVKYMADVQAGALFIHANGYTVLQHNAEDLKRVQQSLHKHASPENKDDVSKASKTTHDPASNGPLMLRSHAYRVEFINANKNAQVSADKPIQSYNNYFIGNDPSKWASHCRIFQAVTISDVYPNIDVRYYTDNGTMKYDLLVKPGGRVSDIALRYDGAEKLEVENKMLHVRTSTGTVRELEPLTYQNLETGRKQINCKYIVKNNVVRFDVKDYDKNQLLVIDPFLIFSSFSNSAANNWGYTATYGPDGSMFGGGIVMANGFPVTPGAVQENFISGDPTDPPARDIGIIKLSPDGSQRLYATYIGGSGNEQPHSLITDGAGNLVIAGRTNSDNYPALSSFGTLGGYDIIVTKLNATGTAILGSKRIGGSGDDGVNISRSRLRGSLQYNYGDDGRSEVIIDASGSVYVASSTRSADFPKLSAFQTTVKGQQDGVILKLSSDISTLAFCTPIGGSEEDAAYVLASNPFNGNIYVGGGTESNDFPGTSGSMQGSNAGGIDGYLAVLTPSGSLVRSTYLGTSEMDQVYGVQFDRMGFPYVMGLTLGNWPVFNATWSQTGGRQFIAKIKPDLSGFVYSTKFGTNSPPYSNISPVAFLVDRCENVYVSGWGGSLSESFKSAGTSGLSVTSDALVMNPPYSSPSHTDGRDFYFFVLKRNATAQLYGSFFGSSAPLPDHVDGGTSRFDANGVIYMAMCANCDAPNPAKPYFPTGPSSVWGPRNGSSQCNLAMVKIALFLSGVAGGVQSSINGVARDSAGCVPLTVDFRDTFQIAQSYEWDRNGDGITDTITTTPNATYTYLSTGTYKVRLIAVDSNSCNIRDTSYLSIRVGSVKTLPSFTPVKFGVCTELKYRFDNNTVPVGGRSFGDSTFKWEFGDGSAPVITGPGPVVHSYPSAGTYKVRLTLLDTSYCNAPDYVDSLLNIAVNVVADIKGPRRGCAPFDAVFRNVSTGGQQFYWDFGNGTTSTSMSPDPVTYNNPGIYTVRLRVVDSATCNIQDETTFTLEVYPKPTAIIGAVSPQPPVLNKPIFFPNNSSPDAVSFKWLFGDGDSLITNSREPVQHEYNETSSYEVTLIAFSANNCTDTARVTVQSLAEAAVDVPNAFTPLSGDANSIVYARGFNISKLKFTIYNRNGQKVFETENRRQGWDGKFKGVLQPMDVYAYTLDVTFFNGRRVVKKGDITLIR